MTKPEVAPDPLFKEAFIDKDEWRDTPVRHRYVHGGFKDSNLRFSFYMPDKAQYQGRFFQYVTPVPDSENLAPNDKGELSKIGFAVASGGYFVETNGGGQGATAGPAFGADPSIGAYRANAAAAQFSKKVAQEMYGPHRTYGYLYGGSGGGYRTLGSMEHTKNVWDGAVPFVLGSPMAAPNVFAVRMHAMRILKDRFPQIIDAMDAGGSGDPTAGFTDEEKAAWAEVTAMGFPPKSWFGYDTMGVHAFTALYQGMVMADPKYFEDFWTVPGYLGANPPDSLKKARLQFKSTIKVAISEEEAVARHLPNVNIPGASRGTAEMAWAKLVTDGSKRPVAFELADAPPDVGFLGGDLIIQSGEAAGKRLPVRLLVGNQVTLGVVKYDVLAKVKPGDEVQLDNSNFLAAQTYHRHQVPRIEDGYTVWDQFRDKDGKPIYPQRKMQLAPMFTLGAAGTVPSGKFNGKMIVVQSLLDREAFPWQADWYARKFNANYGKDAPNRFRLWYTENALHGGGEDQMAPARVINYVPMLFQALRDVSAWVETGKAPPANTSYKVVDGQVIVPNTAGARHGIQPTLSLRANGKTRADVATGQPVTLTATAEAPPGTGKIIAARWDLDGSGKFATEATLPAKPVTKLTIKTTTSFAAPGTYFPVLKIWSQRDGDTTTPYARLPNLARVRVVVK